MQDDASRKSDSRSRDELAPPLAVPVLADGTTRDACTTISQSNLGQVILLLFL